jgi:hypothetical protein
MLGYFVVTRSTNVKPCATNNNYGLNYNDQIFNIAQVIKSLVRPSRQFAFIGLIIFTSSFVHYVKMTQHAPKNGPMMHPKYWMLGCNTLVSSNATKEKVKIRLYATMVIVDIYTYTHVLKSRSFLQTHISSCFPLIHV